MAEPVLGEQRDTEPGVIEMAAELSSRGMKYITARNPR
jgi:hypothetical protein